MQLLYIHDILQWEGTPGEVKTGGKGWDWWYGASSTCLDDGNLSRNIHTWILNMLAVQIWRWKGFHKFITAIHPTPKWSNELCALLVSQNERLI